jgi:hypothetical protein
LVVYLQLGSESFNTAVDEDRSDLIGWATVASDGAAVHKQARLSRIIFVR